ncbi:hypothetical protein JOQ06_003471, partial [Pogonophryne albipinna]
MSLGDGFTGIVRKKQWCEMVPCLEDEGCDLLVNKSGWTCTQPGGRVKTTTAYRRLSPERRVLCIVPSTILDWQMKGQKELSLSACADAGCSFMLPDEISLTPPPKPPRFWV